MFSLGTYLHGQLLKIFEKKPHFVGRVYALGIMACTVVTRVSIKVEQGSLTSRELHLLVSEQSELPGPLLGHHQPKVRAGTLAHKKTEVFSKCKPEMSRNLALALSISFGMSCGISSMKLVPLSVFAIVLNLKPIMVVLIGLCFGVETLTLQKVLFILLSFVGAGLIVEPSFFLGLLHVTSYRSVPPDPGSGVTKGSRSNRRPAVLLGMQPGPFVRHVQSYHLHPDQKERYLFLCTNLEPRARTPTSRCS